MKCKDLAALLLETPELDVVLHSEWGLERDVIVKQIKIDLADQNELMYDAEMLQNIRDKIAEYNCRDFQQEYENLIGVSSALDRIGSTRSSREDAIAYWGSFEEFQKLAEDELKSNSLIIANCKHTPVSILVTSNDL